MKTQTTKELAQSQVLDPRQERFVEAYCEASSPTFGNCYQSAIKAGYSDLTARNITHNRPKWYSETLGKREGLQPEHLIIKLSQLINDPGIATQHKLKAIDMLMRSNRMYAPTYQNAKLLKAQDVLD